MRTPRARLVAAACLLPLLAAAPAQAEAGAPVGGDALGTRGTVQAAGTPALPRTVASGWLVADLDTGAVLAARDPHGRYAPASTLKILTALTVLPHLPANRLVTPTFDDVRVDGSRVGLVEHVAYRVDALATAMLVVSGNDAADALATANGGGALTIAQMNAVAAHLQALDTHAATVNGLDAPGQTSSPYDLAVIARAAMQSKAFRHYVATRNAVLRGSKGRPIAIGNHDRLLFNYPGAIGIKNGYTVKAQASFVGAAARGGHTLAVVLMHTAPRYWPEAAALLDWGFAAEAAGAVPVGRLVDPADPSAAPVGGAPPDAPGAAQAAGALSGRRMGGVPLVPLGAVVAGGAAAALVLRHRRRRSSGLRLPRA